ncbi:hypothetical protein AOLI_G00174800 [Acnodon oligacanthus]
MGFEVWPLFRDEIRNLAFLVNSCPVAAGEGLFPNIPIPTPTDSGRVWSGPRPVLLFQPLSESGRGRAGWVMEPAALRYQCSSFTLPSALSPAAF